MQQPSPQPLEEPIDKPPTKPSKRWALVPSWFSLFIASSGWAVAVLMGILDLPTKLISFCRDFPIATKTVDRSLFVDESFAGTWSSQFDEKIEDVTADADLEPIEPAGDLIGGEEPLPERVQIRLQNYRGNVKGEITSEHLERGYVSFPIFIEGVISEGKVYGIAFDYIDGKKTPFANIEFDKSDTKGLIFYNRSYDRAPYFPSKVILYRSQKPVPQAINTELLMGAASVAKQGSNK